MQRTFGDTVGLEPVVSVRPHHEDPIECADGTVRNREDVFFAVDGKAYGTEDERTEAETQLVREVLETSAKWVESYTSGEYNNDYGDGYAYVVAESDFGHHVQQWVDDYRLDNSEAWDDAHVKRIAEGIIERIGDRNEFDSKFDSCEYSCYSGSGICLYSLDIGEYEDQIEVSAHDTLADLDSEGRLESILGELDRDFCIYRFSHYDPETKDRTYDNYVRHGCLMLTHAPGGQWHYVVSEENARLYLAEAICDLCREIDGK